MCYRVVYLIEDGEVFEGEAWQLDDCFGISVDELDDWCAVHNWSWTNTIRKFNGE